MAKVFTITEGLENLGAMKTGGQGSVYKGRRVGEIITAIKLLPTPIYSESTEDKNYTDFQNEVQKLRKVNEVPNPHVVRILSSGITDSGNFPFIEMEYIEGPDLEDLLKPPHDPVFTIKETIKVAEQLSNALAHCHKLSVKHGDIKSNNVKFNSRTGNYILLDFGLSAMSDEQRRTSLRHAGAIEFMAPEQNEGLMMFQTDVYSFGVILFELLTGTVPFPLTDKGESARNQVRLAHMESPPPDLLQLRRMKIPASWSDDKKQHEKDVPDWIVQMVYRCLRKGTGERFANGIELHDYVILNSSLSGRKPAVPGDDLYQQTENVYHEKEALQKELLALRQKYETREKELDNLKALVHHKDRELEELRSSGPDYAPASGKKTGSTILVLLLLAILGLGAYAAYKFYYQAKRPARSASIQDQKPVRREPVRNDDDRMGRPEKKETVPADTPKAEMPKPVTRPQETITEPLPDTNTKKVERTEPPPVTTDVETEVTGRYKVISKAYFYDQPREETRRNAYIVHWNNATLNGLNEENDFVYVVFTNNLGQTSKGWLRKKDLNKIEE
ncbi:serine/threonine protein kinase [Segetibacter sp. 3557_3]|uniref:serine/threonine protein kinase n=1 Tax=Segetibacter sp. 3557_3 TaxID=2547429 RepID=UPI001058B0E2|nr:serine/threonine-protein kinase [Segetibacter sp. 3557_3]TDH26566.1 serine/threonine protein kinase [Segetibacter sp. 3557_3]